MSVFVVIHLYKTRLSVFLTLWSSKLAKIYRLYKNTPKVGVGLSGYIVVLRSFYFVTGESVSGALSIKSMN